MSMKLVAVFGLTCALTGACAYGVIQPHLPGSPQKLLEQKQRALTVMTAAQRDAAASSWLWYGNFQRLHIQARQEKEAASTALTEASRQCRANSDRSYQSGLAAGRALERSRHATPQTDTRPSDAADDGGLQFDQLWDATGAAGRGQN